MIERSQLHTARNLILWGCAFGMLLGFAAVFEATGFFAAPWGGYTGVTLGDSNIAYNAEVYSVEPGSPAERAGLRTGDRIDIRTVPTIERWQWFGGFVTAMNGVPTTFALLRGAQRLRVTIVPVPWNLAHYWYFFAGPVGMIVILAFGALIAWRDPDSSRSLILAGVLLAIGAGALGATANFPSPFVASYVAVELLTLALPGSIALWAFYAGTFATPISRTRRFFFILACVSAGAEMLRLIIATGAMLTLWVDPLPILFSAVSFVPFVAASLCATICSAFAIAAARGIERQRAAWTLSSLAVFVAVYNGSSFVQSLAIPYSLFLVSIATFNLNFFVVPAVLAYAALARRLIDIGFVLNRAAIFALVSAIVIGTFILIEWALGKWLADATRVTSTVVSLLFVLGLGLSMRSIHLFVDRFVDNVFFRKRHEDEAALRRFAHEAAYFSDAGALIERATAVVMRHTAATCARVVRPDREGIDADDAALVALRAWNRPVDLHDYPDTALRGELAFPLRPRNELLGTLVCGAKGTGEAYAPDEVEALSELARGVGLTLLFLELHAQLAAVSS